MSRNTLTTTCLAVLFALSSGPLAVGAAVGEEEGLFKAYFLEHEEGEYSQAKALYDKVLASRASATVSRAARAGSARCRDHLAAEDFATLMPPDALVYVELNRPGDALEKLAEMLGLTAESMQELLAERPGTASQSMVRIPSEVAISPAIFDHFNQFGGAAIAITNIDFEGGPPEGVLVLHHGDVNLMKGILETAFQFAPTAEKIADMPTFGIQAPEVGEVVGVLTESLLIVGTGRDLVEGAVGRLVGKQRESLSSREDLKEAVGDRPDCTIFAYGNLQGIFRAVKSHMDEGDKQELAIANAIVDLDSLRWATFSIGIDEGHLGWQFAVRFADDHNSIAYNMLRLPPLSKDCLSMIPANAAAFLGIGLNPALAQVAMNAAGDRSKSGPVTGLDIPRELFGNIKEICAFVIPGQMGKSGGGEPIPNAGIVFSVNDIAKSKSLWNQILTIPGLVGGDEPVEPKEIKIGRMPVTVYAIPELGKLYMAELDGCIAMGLTRSAVKACIRTQTKGKSILDDKVLGGAVGRMPSQSSIIVAAHVGRLAEVASGMGDDGMAMVAKPAAQLCRNMVGWFALGQSPTQLTLKSEIGGLPDVNEALKQFGPMLNAAAGMAFRTSSPRPRRDYTHDDTETDVSDRVVQSELP